VKPGRRLAAIALLSLLVPYALAADDAPLLQARFSVEMDRIPSLRAERLPATVPEGAVSESEAAAARARTASQAILDEARWVFGGMVYGFDFSYTPSDIARRVEEAFSLEPRNEVRWGDAGLRVAETRVEGTVLTAMIAYRPGPDGAATYRSWASTALGSSFGRGSAPLDGAFGARRNATILAVKSAVREYFRVLTKNKPKACRGSCALVDAPVLSSSSGGWTSSVRVRIDVGEIVPYTVF